MGPNRNRFWLPLTRLGTFFVTVVVVGNVVFHAFRPSAADFTSPDEFTDYYTKKRKRIQRQFQRTLEKFLGFPAQERTAPDRVQETPARTTEIVQVASPPSTPPLQAISPPAPPPSAARAPTLGFVAPEPAPFIWPEPLRPLRPPPVPEFDVPRSLGLIDETLFRAELVTEWYRRGAPDPAADVTDMLLKGPELLIDSIFTCAGRGSRVAVRNWDDDDGRSLTEQMLDVGIGPRSERIGREFLFQLGQREGKYFANFEDSRANSFAFQNGTADADLKDLIVDQRKVFWDALRRTYLARYKVTAEEKMKEDAWYFDRWSSWDFAVLPPLLGAYVYYRGVDKKFSVFGTRLTVSVEPVSEWIRKDRDLSAAASMEWSMKGWPLGVIVSTGLHDGKFGLDFVGIGTSIGAVRQALEEETRMAERR